MQTSKFLLAAIAVVVFSLSGCGTGSSATDRPGGTPNGGGGGAAGAAANAGASGTGNGGAGGGACAPESDSAFCTRLGKACGSVTDIDNCGASRTVAVCGDCTPPATCGAANTCGCTAEADTAFCTRVGRNCGAVTDVDACGTSRTVASCGTCTAPDVCSAGHVCGPANCVAETDTAFCTRMHDACGAVTNTDNCGTARTVASCGTCTAPQTCGATHTCSCVSEDSATFCARLAKSCGTVTAPDNCGVSRTVTSCGACAAPQTCGGGGTANVCGGGGTAGGGGAGGVFIPPDGGQGGAGAGGFTSVDAAVLQTVGNRKTFNFNLGWKFIKQDVPAATAAAFDDAAWTDVTLPHTFDDVDGFGFNWVGVRTTYNGKSWYRKHFTMDAADAGRKVFVEFQSMRNMGTVYVNGTNIGFHQDEVSPAGFDISAAVKTGDNVIAVQIDANDLQLDQTVAPGVSYDWSTAVFYPKYGGLPADANLIITDTLHQTLPLWVNLKTQGVYVYADPATVDTAAKSATVTVESEVQNESGGALDVTLTMEVFDHDAKSVGTATAAPQQLASGAKVVIKAEKALTGMHFWAPNYPYLYTVRSTISVGGKPGDSVDIPFGIRKFSFNATNGFKINGHSTYLPGFAPRTIMDWAGAGIPQDWMNEYDYLLMKGMNHFFIRPMHVGPVPHMVTSADRLGIIMVVPAGDGEGCGDAARWPQHLALMQAEVIYFRNNPSVAFYEGCNSGLTEAQVSGMVQIRKTWDPHGSRYMGDRGTDPQNQPSMEYESPMDGTGQSPDRPLWSAEYARQESPRRIWDAYSPVWDPNTNTIVTGGLIKVCNHGRWGTTLETANGNGIAEYPLCDFRLNSSEDLSLCFAYRYWEGYAKSNFVLDAASRTSKGIQIGGAKIIFNDSYTDGRLQLTEVARVGGVVDGVRIIKDNYYVLKVASSLTPDIHILGHWNYAAGTTKTVYVASNTESVTLAVYDANGALLKDYGKGAIDTRTNPVNHYIFAFPNVAFQAGKIKAVGLNGTAAVANDEHVTTGAPAGLVLTPIYGPQGWMADGADIAMVDIEVVDAAGRRVPTETSDITFTHSGAGTWIGGYNSGLAQRNTGDPGDVANPNQGIFKDALKTDAGINRVLVRSTRTAGTFTIKVSRAGLADASITLNSQAFPVPASGLATVWPQHYTLALPAEPAPAADN